MAKESIHETRLREALSQESAIPEKFRQILLQFVAGYRQALGPLFDQQVPNLLLFFELVLPQFSKPYQFQPYHQKIRHPIDYYRFGLDFVRPLVDETKSRIDGLDELSWIEKRLKNQENVVLLANHQTEADPQVIALLLEKNYPEIAEKMIFVAGERVITDPMAIPFSMGCDLLCIYSKRYIDHPLELKEQKLLHNKHTMEKMSRLLQEGGKIIYVAPSGGRDRKNSQGIIELSPFDPASIEMFYLMAKKGKTPTHFIPFALATYDLLPPPETIQKELGEHRIAKRVPTFIGFGEPFPMEMETKDRKEGREIRAKKIWEIVKTMYDRF